MRILSTLFASALAVAMLVAPATAADERPPMLLGRAILPSDAYQPGPPSGAFITGDNGVTPPFPGQPIPGFSAVLDAGHGEFLAMPDNGYGAKANSGDFLLRLYRIRPEFKAPGNRGLLDRARARNVVVGILAAISGCCCTSFTGTRPRPCPHVSSAMTSTMSFAQTKSSGSWWSRWARASSRRDSRGITLGRPVKSRTLRTGDPRGTTRCSCRRRDRSRSASRSRSATPALSR